MRAGQRDWSLGGTSLPEAPLPEIPGLRRRERQRNRLLLVPSTAKGTPTGPELPGRLPAASPERSPGLRRCSEGATPARESAHRAAPRVHRGRRSPVTAAACIGFLQSRRAPGAWRRSCYPKCKRARRIFSSDDPDGVGRRLSRRSWEPPVRQNGSRAAGTVGIELGVRVSRQYAPA